MVRGEWCTLSLRINQNLFLALLSSGGPEVSKDNIPGRPQFVKAEETFASFPLLAFDIWPLDAEEPVLCFRCERIRLRWIPFHISFLPFWEPVAVNTLKVSELQPHARPASLRRVDFLSIPADPKRGTQEGESQATRQSIQKHRSASEKTQRFCLNHRQVTSTEVYKTHKQTKNPTDKNPPETWYTLTY